MSNQPPNEPQAASTPALIERVERRRDELRASLAGSAISTSTRRDIGAALSAVERMLTGDMSSTTRGFLARWLERSRYLGIVAEAPSATLEAAAIDAPAIEAAPIDAPAIDAPAIDAAASDAPPSDASPSDAPAIDAAAGDAPASDETASDAPAAAT